MTSSRTELTATGRTPSRVDLTQVQGFDLHADYCSARTGGDFFDAIHVGTHVLFLLTDIAGTKEETRPIAAEVQETFRRRGAELFGVPDTNVMDATAQLVQAINHALIGVAQEVRFAPTFLGCYDLSLGILAYVNAGGLTAAFRDSEGTRLLTNVAMPMGLFTHLTYEPSMQAFEPGAKLLLVTKGIVESQRGQAHFGAERVRSVLESAETDSAAELCRSVLDAAHAFEKAPRYSLRSLGFGSGREVEDLTALAVVRRGDGRVA
jgi:serine phosphatase RsbU (regulator of sigma subunit)